MPEITVGQYTLVYNTLSLTVAAMLGSFVFFVLARGLVAQRYRISLILSALVVGIAGYHYFRIFNSWDAAYTLMDGTVTATGKPFNDAYRYVDWLLTVPLLLAELVLVLRLPKREGGPMLWKLTIAAAAMIVLGYPGEIATDNGARALWGTLSTIPFVYILYVLWVQLGRSLPNQPAPVQTLVRNIRLLLLATWGFYPITYMLPFLGIDPSGSVVGIQIGYAAADILAKCAFGIMIYTIARIKTEYDRTAGEGATPVTPQPSVA
jgi:bacteriorhodopsin